MDSALSCAKKGAIGELIASTWLLQQGYEVFRNVSPDGPVDLVAIKGDGVLKIDVKTGITLPSGRVYRNNRIMNSLKNTGVRVLLVLPTSSCIWADEII